MEFTQEEYRRNLNYVRGIFTLGGLSECGKTTAGYRFQELGIRKSKIIHIEYDMMAERGIDSSKATPEDFDNLYNLNPEIAFKEFLFRLIEKMKAENFQFASLESLYRAPLGAFLRKELGSKVANIYIDAPLESRARREMIKLNAKADNGEGSHVTLEEMIQKVDEKDKFKRERKAEDVKKIANCIIVDNSQNISKELFIAQIDAIAASLGVT